MSRSRSAILVLVAAAVVTVLPAVAADTKPTAAPSAPLGKNVLVTLTITKVGGTPAMPPRVFKMIGQDDSEASMLVGWRTPIPMVSSGREDMEKPPVTSYVYQNVGVSARFTINVLDQGRIRLRGSVEISATRNALPGEGGAQKAPLIGTFQQNLALMVTEGKKLRIAEAPDPEGGTVSLEIEASVLP